MSVRNSIENGSLEKGSKLPSIRRLSADLDVSKITITTAYDQLCSEGYIKNKPQSGYYVEANFKNAPAYIENHKENNAPNTNYFEYDFSGKSIDKKIINLNEWKKCVKEVINQDYHLTSYGNEQGEEALRNALQSYALGVRSVNTSSDNIVVGAGTQPLLNIICSLVGTNKVVAVADSSYVQAEYIFKSYGYKIEYFESDNSGATISSMEQIKPNIILINPNFVTSSGASMPINRRLEIIAWAKENNTLIIEDDYNGELRYSTHPTPCMQNYDTENTIYLGSFSKILLPSVRISYMVLPKNLICKYREIKSFTNQTASKSEQLALAKYIYNGKIDIHLRKARRVYLEKSKIILNSIKRNFDNNIKIIFNETSLYVTVKLNNNIDMDGLINKLKENSVNVMSAKSNNILNLSFSGIDEEKIDKGIRIIRKVLK
ncbi:MAG: PLP-dependent aminotransferase family protein [Ruminococcus sp.]|nr:PLP-dependent aminotransferase family protein [Ruminococcus sp.]